MPGLLHAIVRLQLIGATVCVFVAGVCWPSHYPGGLDTHWGSPFIFGARQHDVGTNMPLGISASVNPLALAANMFIWGVPLFGLLFVLLRLADNLAAGLRCRGCGYDLRLNRSGDCPECGRAVSARQRRLMDRDTDRLEASSRRRLLGLGLATAVAFVAITIVFTGRFREDSYHFICSTCGQRWQNRVTFLWFIPIWYAPGPGSHTATDHPPSYHGGHVVIRPWTFLEGRGPMEFGGHGYRSP